MHDDMELYLCIYKHLHMNMFVCSDVVIPPPIFLCICTVPFTGKRYQLRERRKAIDDKDGVIQTHLESLEEKTQQVAALKEQLKQSQINLQNMTGEFHHTYTNTYICAYQMK